MRGGYLADLDPCDTRQTREQPVKVFSFQRHTPGRGQEAGPRHMNENRAAAVLYSGARVVIQFDHQIVQMIFALQTVARARGRQPDWRIVTPIIGVFAPAVVGADWPCRQERARARQTVGAPPKPHKPETAARRRAVALKLVGPDACAAKRHQSRCTAEPQLSTRGAARRACDAEDGGLTQPFPPVHVSNRNILPHLPRPVPWSSSAPSETCRNRLKSCLLAGSG
jgi:hypothetical protein